MIIYAKNSKDRKKEYRLITTINEVENKLLVSKKAASTSAKGHLLSLVDKYEKIKLRFKELQVVAPNLSKNSLFFPYIDGTNLLDEFTRHYLNNEEDKAIGILYEFKQLLNNLTTINYDVGNNKVFTNVFGKSRSGEEECVKVGCLDMNLDNLIRESGKFYLIDYEWVFDTPLPRDFLYFRTLLYCFATVKEVLENRCSNEYRLVDIWPGVLIPKKIYDEEFPSYPNLKRFSKYEANFQSYVSESGGSRPARFYRPKELTQAHASNGFTYITHLENTVNDLQDTIKTRDSQLEGKDKELKNVYNSKAWRLAMKIKRLKNLAVLNKRE